MIFLCLSDLTEHYLIFVFASFFTKQRNNLTQLFFSSFIFFSTVSNFGTFLSSNFSTFYFLFSTLGADLDFLFTAVTQLHFFLNCSFSFLLALPLLVPENLQDLLCIVFSQENHVVQRFSRILFCLLMSLLSRALWTSTF